MAKPQKQKTNLWLPGAGNREELFTKGYGGIWGGGRVMELFYILIVVVQV